MPESRFENNEGRQGWRDEKRLVWLEGHEALMRVDYHRRWSCIANARDASEADLSHGTCAGSTTRWTTRSSSSSRSKTTVSLRMFNTSIGAAAFLFPRVGPLPIRKGALFVPREDALNVSDF